VNARLAEAHLVIRYGMDPDRASRAVDIARDCELNNEPVTGGYITITCTQRHRPPFEYAIEPHTEQEKMT